MAPQQATENSNPASLPIELVKVKPGFNPRKYFDPVKHKELVDSIRVHGIIEPLIIRPVAERDGSYWLICGERRYRAAKEAGLTNIPVLAREIDEAGALLLAIIENSTRDDISPAEEAQSVLDVLTSCGGDRQEAQKLLGWNVGKFESRMLLLHAAQEVLEALTERKIKIGHAELLSQLPTDIQVATLAKIVSDGYTIATMARHW